MLHLHLSDQQFHCLLKVSLILEVWQNINKYKLCRAINDIASLYVHNDECIRNSQNITHTLMTCIQSLNYVLHPLYNDIISYPLFADADTGIYPHAASRYHARPKAKRGIAMLSVDKFPYPRKQTRGNEFIPCSNNICDILKRFRSFKIPAITLIWPKSSYKHSVTRSYRSGKESGRRSESPLWRHQWAFLCLYISRWWRQTWDTAPYFTVVNQSEARISTEHGITSYIKLHYNGTWLY